MKISQSGIPGAIFGQLDVHLISEDPYISMLKDYIISDAFPAFFLSQFCVKVWDTAAHV